MSADLRIDFGFFEHRKTKKLIARCGLQGVWSLLKLWHRTAETRPKGQLTGMDETDIALDAEWPGDAADFCIALCDIRWLDKGDDGVYSLHDWREHQPWIFLSEERSAQARDAAIIMWNKKRLKSAKKAALKRTASAPLTEGNAPFLSFPYPSLLERDKNIVPPMIEWVTAYCAERKNGINPKAWMNHYEAKNWMIGKNKMVDWEAGVRTWEKDKDDDKQKPLGGLAY
jgi:hypothetical protein